MPFYSSILLKLFSIALAQPILHIIPEIENEASNRLLFITFSAMLVDAATTLNSGLGCWLHPIIKSKLIRKNSNDFMRMIYCVNVLINLKTFPTFAQ